MKVMAAKGRVMIEEDGSLAAFDVVEHENKLWLVPEWIASISEKIQRPARMICLDGLLVTGLAEKYQGAIVLNTSIPMRVLLGHEQSQTLVVVEAPNLDVPLPRDAMN